MVTGGLKSGHCVILIAFERCTSCEDEYGGKRDTKSEGSGHTESLAMCLGAVFPTLTGDGMASQVPRVGEESGSVLECACQATLGIHIVGSVLIFILLKRKKEIKEITYPMRQQF